MIENPSNLTQQLLNLVERVAVEIRAIYNKLQTAVFKVNGQIPDSDGNIQIDAVTKAMQDGNGNVISNTYVKKTDKVTSASSADSAIKATQDASGNVITSTYATKSELTSGLGGKSDTSHTHLISDVTNLQSSLNAKLATSTYNTDKATFATKSELNAIDVGVTSFNGSKGAVTYTAPVTSVNGNTGAVTVSTITGNAGTATKLATPRTITLAGDATGSASFDGSGDVTLDVTVSGGGSGDAVPKTGDRGLLSGYNTCGVIYAEEGDLITIDENSPDDMAIIQNGSFTLSFEINTSKSFVKNILLFCEPAGVEVIFAETVFADTFFQNGYVNDLGLSVANQIVFASYVMDDGDGPYPIGFVSNKVFM